MRKKGIVERLVISAPSENDFSYDKLPQNRKKLFSYMLKNKFFKIYKNHFFTSLFFVPLIVWCVLTMNYTDFVFGLQANEGITHFVEHWVTVYVTAIPLWSLAFWGLAGGLNVLKKLAWSDPLIFKTDFIKGIKSSGKQLAFIGFLWGTAYALIRYATNWLGFYYRVFDDSYSVIFGIFVCFFVLLLAIGYTVYAVCMASMYNVTLKQLFVGAFKLYLSDIFLATGVVLLCLLPMAFLVISDLAIVPLIVYLLLLGLLIGFLIIPPFLVCQHTFDRIINKKDYPNYYGRGLSYGVYEQKETLEIASDVEEIIDTKETENDFERVNDDED
ncbi:MAG: hypothetical protein J6S23_07845 [Clostridia bacterium]|nr:hypothetical protein [Clostridia bacterium]